MKFTMERKPLLEALTLAGRVVARRNTIPILSHVLIATQGKAIAITGTDMDRLLTVEAAAASIGTKGSTTVNAANLSAFVRATPDGGQIEAELDEAKGRLVLRAGRARASLPVLPPADFPAGVTETWTASFDVRGDELARALKRVAHAQSNEETRFYLNGVYLHRHDTGLRLVATDGHRLALTALALDAEPPADLPGVIVPRAAVADLIALAESAERLSIEVSANRLQASLKPETGSGVVLCTRLIDGTFPDYHRVIPSDNDVGLQVDRQGFLAAVERCGAFRGDEKTQAVRMTPDKTSVQLSRRDADQGDIEDAIDVQSRGKSSETGFNHAYMSAALDALTGATLDLEYTPGGPILLRDPADRDGQLQVVMAMRV